MSSRAHYASDLLRCRARLPLPWWVLCCCCCLLSLEMKLLWIVRKFSLQKLITSQVRDTFDDLLLPAIAMDHTFHFRRGSERVTRRDLEGPAEIVELLSGERRRIALPFAFWIASQRFQCCTVEADREVL